MSYRSGDIVNQQYLGAMDNMCRHCGAMLFPMANLTSCCNNGKVFVDNFSELLQEIFEIINSDENFMTNYPLIAL